MHFSSKGFSIVEMLVTVFIISILASAALPMVELAVQRNKEEQLRSGLREIRMAINDYKKAVDSGHILRRLDESGYPPSLDLLVQGVIDLKDPKGGKIYFLRRIPRDPFFTEDIAQPAKTWGLRSYQSPPDEPTEGDDVFDIFSYATSLGLNGIAYREW